MQALLNACAVGKTGGAEVAVVIANVPGAKALDKARAAGVPARLMRHGDYASRDAYDTAMVTELRGHGVELVCLAGFMRLIGPVLLGAYSSRILNIHPALLPAFPGMHAVRQALAAGVRIAGCTVHVVDEGTDTGPIVVQAAVPVLDEDTEETLSARILRQEHRCYPRAVQLFAEGRISIAGRQVRVQGAPGDAARVLASPSLAD